MATHHEDLGLGTAHRAFVEAQCIPVEPFRPRLLVVPKPKPQAFELSKLLPMPVLAKIDDVGHAQGLELFHVLPCLDGTAKPQPSANAEGPHGCRPSQLRPGP